MVVSDSENYPNNDIELQEFRQMVNFYEHNSNKWVEIFNKFDKDADGKITFKELKRQLNEYDHGIPTSTVRKILRKGDTNENGTIELNEFLNLVKSNTEIRGLFSQSVDRWVTAVCVVPKRAPIVRGKDVTDSEFEYDDHYTCCPPPLFMIIISLLELIAYIYDAVDQKPGQDLVTTELATLFIYNPKRRAEAWRYLTYMFVHVNVFHLLINLFVQTILGVPLEMVHRWWRVLIVYVAGVIAGSLGTSVTDPATYLAGASGGVYALITANVATIIMNWSNMKFALLQITAFFILAVVDVGSAVYYRYVLKEINQVGYVAHFAGAVAGLLIGFNVLRNFEVRPWERKLRWVAILLYIVLMLMMIIWNVAFPSYFPKQRYS